MARHRVYLDTRVLTAFFFAAMPFVAFGSFVVVNTARTQLRESVGAGLEQRALQTKLGIEHYLSEQVLHLRLVSADPAVQRALSTPRRVLSPSALHRLERDWRSLRDAKQTAATVETPLAERLRTLVALRPMLRQLQVVDGQGLVVAASRRPARIFHGETAWFQRLALQDAEPEAYIGDLQRSPGSMGTLLELAYPVRDSKGATVGAVHALLDGHDIYTVLAPVRLGRTGHAVLIRTRDGIVLASDESERILTTVYPGFDALQNAILGFPIAESGQALFGRTRVSRGYWTLPEVKRQGEGGEVGSVLIEPARLVGFCPIDRLADVHWLVAVEQDLAEALAPVESVTRYLWIHFIGVFVTVILLALYFSFKLERPVMDAKLHLHEAHLPAGTRKTEE